MRSNKGKDSDDKEKLGSSVPFCSLHSPPPSISMSGIPRIVDGQLVYQRPSASRGAAHPAQRGRTKKSKHPLHRRVRRECRKWRRDVCGNSTGRAAAIIAALVTWALLIAWASPGWRVPLLSVGILAGIWTCLSGGDADRAESASAYSVFNPDGQRLQGTLTAEQFDPRHGLAN